MSTVLPPLLALHCSRRLALLLLLLLLLLPQAASREDRAHEHAAVTALPRVRILLLWMSCPGSQWPTSNGS